MHGLANGEIRANAGKMDLFQSVEGPDTIYPDGLIADEALRQLEILSGTANESPFLLAVGFIRPHLPFGAPARYMDPYRDRALPPIPHPEKPTGLSTWHGSGEFMKYNRWNRDPRQDAEMADQVRRHYAACVSYADAQVGKLLDKLRALKLDDNTVVVLWGDHGWHLGEHAIWGKHSLFEESLRSPLIVRAPEVAQVGQATDAVVETIDIYPTLCDLCGIARPERLDGASLLPQLADSQASGRVAVSYQANRETLRTERYRLIRHRQRDQPPRFELYDHHRPDAETKNLADQEPEIVRELTAMLDERLQPSANP
jgi:iduronate 2-sulfatase